MDIGSAARGAEGAGEDGLHFGDKQWVGQQIC